MGCPNKSNLCGLCPLVRDGTRGLFQQKYTMKPKLYAIISNIVLDGVNQGFRNTRTLIPKKDEENLTENIHMAVMRELSEYFDFSQDGKE